MNEQKYCDAIHNGREQLLHCAALFDRTFADIEAHPECRPEAERLLSNTGSCAYLLDVVCKEFMTEHPQCMGTLGDDIIDIAKLGNEWNALLPAGRKHWECGISALDRPTPSRNLIGARKFICRGDLVQRCVTASKALTLPLGPSGGTQRPRAVTLAPAPQAPTPINPAPQLQAQYRQRNLEKYDEIMREIIVLANLNIKNIEQVTGGADGDLARQCALAHVYLFYEYCELVALDIFEYWNLAQYDATTDGCHYHVWTCRQMIVHGIFPANLYGRLDRVRQLRNAWKRQSLYGVPIDDLLLRNGFEDCRELYKSLLTSIFYA